jgi:hypothetical protein
MCLFLGHDWFPTVVTRHYWETWEEPVIFLWEYEERICLRCQKNEAVKVRELDYWNYVLGRNRPPAWYGGPKTQHFGYPGDWIS